MGWTVDTSGQSTYGVSNPNTLSLTLASTAKLLVAVIFVNGNTARTGGAPTYNSIEMTDSSEGFVVHTEAGVEVWYLTNPSTGTAYDVSVPNSGAVNLQISAISFIPDTGGAAYDNSNSATGTTDDPSLSLTVGATGNLIVGAVGSGDRDDVSAGTNFTLLHTHDAGNQVWGSEYDLAGSATPVTVDFVTARADDWGLIGISFEEIAAQKTGSVTADAAVKKAQSGSVTADAAIERSVSGSITADADIAATPVVNQPHFRIRSDDTVALNTDSGWAANLDTDATINVHTRFRIRFEVEETAGGSFSSPLKVQFNHNVGGWEDCADTYDINDPDLSTAQPQVWMGESNMYTDLDNTTDLLSGSSETFTAGDGNEDPVTVTVSLTNQHTEHEFCLVIPSFFSGTSNNQNADGDTFDFRLVESDGTPFNGSYTNPRVTLNVPDYHIGGCHIETPDHMGPFVDGNDNIYYVIENAHPGEAGSEQWTMIKSTDDGKTWAEVDGANRPGDTDMESLSCVQSGTKIHMVHSPGNQANYAEFCTSDDGSNPDTWQNVELNFSGAYTATPLMQNVSLAVLSGGNVWAFYSENDGSNERIRYRQRTGPSTWGGENTLDATASTDFPSCSVIVGENDLTHIFYQDLTNLNVLHKTLTSGGSLSGPDTVMTDVDTSAEMNFAPPVYYDDGGVEVIMIAYHKDADDIVYTRTYRDNVIQSEATASASAVEVNPLDTDSEQGTYFIANDGKTVYLLYSRSSDQDIWRDSNDDEGGWGTDASEITSVKCVFIRGRVITHGGGKVLAFVYEDAEATGTISTDGGYAGGLKYAEFSLLTEYTDSVTADATLKKTQSSSVAADAAIESEQTGSITADANIVVTTSDSITGDATIQAEQTGSVTADSAFQSEQTDFIVADAAIEREETGSVTADAALQVEQTDSVAADATIESEQTGSVTADAAIESEQTDSVTADAAIESEQTGSITADANIAGGEITDSITADAAIQSEQTDSVTADAAIESEQTGSVTADAVIGPECFGPWSAIWSNPVVAAEFITADAAIQAEQTGSITADAAIEREETGSITADATIQAEETDSITADAAIEAEKTGSITADAVIESEVTDSVVADATIQAEQTDSVAADATIEAEQTGSITADAVIEGELTDSITADAAIERSETDSITADAVIQVEETDSITADATIEAEQTASITADANISTGTGGAVIAYAAIQAEQTGSVTADAAIERARTGSITADATIQVEETGSVAADATIEGEISDSVTADAAIERAVTDSIVANATILAEVSGSITADADIVLATVTDSITADATIFVGQSGSITADAVIQVVGVGRKPTFKGMFRGIGKKLQRHSR